MKRRVSFRKGQVAARVDVVGGVGRVSFVTVDDVSAGVATVSADRESTRPRAFDAASGRALAGPGTRGASFSRLVATERALVQMRLGHLVLATGESAPALHGQSVAGADYCPSDELAEDMIDELENAGYVFPEDHEAELAEVTGRAVGRRGAPRLRPSRGRKGRS